MYRKKHSIYKGLVLIAVSDIHQGSWNISSKVGLLYRLYLSIVILAIYHSAIIQLWATNHKCKFKKKKPVSSSNSAHRNIFVLQGEFMELYLLPHDLPSTFARGGASLKVSSLS